MRYAHPGCAAVLLLVSTSCGGGGGGGSPSLEPPIAITADNARAIASSVWLGHAMASADEVVPDQARAVLYDYLPLLGHRPGTNAHPMEIACGTSGTVVVDGALADAAAPGMSEGDRATAEFRSCLQAYPSSIFPVMTDGKLEVQVTSSTPEARTVSVILDSLRMGMSESETYTDVGELALTLSNDGTAASLSTELLTATGGGRVLVLEDYLLGVEPAATGTLLTFRGRQSGVEFQGSVSFDTPTPFHLPDDGSPDAGELVVTGAAGSSVTVRAQPDGIHVLLAVNGGAPVEITWVELEE